MKKLEAMAFDWADEHCRCSEDDDGYCEANGMRKGFEAGFREAREMAAEMCERHILGDYGRGAARSIRQIGEGEVSDDDKT